MPEDRKTALLNEIKREYQRLGVDAGMIDQQIQKIAALPMAELYAMYSQLSQGRPSTTFGSIGGPKPAGIAANNSLLDWFGGGGSSSLPLPSVPSNTEPAAGADQGQPLAQAAEDGTGTFKPSMPLPYGIDTNPLIPEEEKNRLRQLVQNWSESTMVNDYGDVTSTPFAKDSVWGEMLIEEAQYLIKKYDPKSAGMGGGGGGRDLRMSEYEAARLGLDREQLGENQRQFDISHALRKEQEENSLRQSLANLRMSGLGLRQNAASDMLNTRRMLAPYTLPEGMTMVPGDQPGGIFNRLGLSQLPVNTIDMSQMGGFANNGGQDVVDEFMAYLQARGGG